MMMMLMMMVMVMTMVMMMTMVMVMMMKLTAKVLLVIRWQTNVILKDLCRQLERTMVKDS